MPRLLINHSQATLLNVDRAVGRNAPNDRLDVLLVQFLILNSTKKVWWRNSVDPHRFDPAFSVAPGMRAVGTPVLRDPTMGITHKKPAEDIIIDGFCGDQTIGYIEWFQEQMQLANQGVELDGQVAPLQNSGTTTLSRLNHVLVLAYQPWIVDQSPGFPYELRSYFYF